jgi:hypothetical protein
MKIMDFNSISQSGKKTPLWDSPKVLFVIGNSLVYSLRSPRPGDPRGQGTGRTGTDIFRAKSPPGSSMKILRPIAILADRD